MSFQRISSRLAQLTLATIVIVYAPLFICMPLWCDVTLYDMAARNILHGGVHYHDIFDTNLPGVVWVVALVRSVFGWSSEALRIWDLLVLAGISAILFRWVTRCTGRYDHAWWLVVAVFLFYLFTSEFNHCQRDVWMLLPACCAAYYRSSRIVDPRDSSSRRVIATAVLEGFLWGMAVWLKPHVVIPAFCCWVLSIRNIYATHGSKTVIEDAIGLLIGGLLMGLLGLFWLWGTGAWADFVDIFTNWNPEYVGTPWRGLTYRVTKSLKMFSPWSVIHLLAVPLSLLDVWRVVRSRSANPDGSIDQQLITTQLWRGQLVMLYLGWLIQAFMLQKDFPYVQIPSLILGFAVIASHRCPVGLIGLSWIVISACVMTFAGTSEEATRAISKWNQMVPWLRVELHPMVDSHRLALWSTCITSGSTPRVKDSLSFDGQGPAGTRWEDLDRVAVYLKGVNPPLGDYELTAFHDGTHPLYLILDRQPSTRYMHFGTALGFRSKADRISDEISHSRQRYVVSDLGRMTQRPQDALLSGAEGHDDRLPRWFPRSQRDQFPWDQPIVFRSGRYLVHRINHPVGRVEIPAWSELDRLGPGE